MQVNVRIESRFFFWLRANRCTSCQKPKLKTENVKSENPSRRPKTKTRQRRRIRGWAAAVNGKPPTRHPRVDIIVFPAPICDSWFPSPGCSCLPACRRRCDVLWVSLAALLLAVHPPARCNDFFLNGSLTALRLCGFFLQDLSKGHLRSCQKVLEILLIGEFLRPDLA